MLLTTRLAPTLPTHSSSPHDVAAGSGRSCVREWPGRYEDEGSERLARGAVAVARHGWWSATLSVPVQADAREDLPVTVRLTRLGPGAEQAVAPEVLLQVTVRELDAVVALLRGVVAQARRDGVLPAA